MGEGAAKRRMSRRLGAPRPGRLPGVFLEIEMNLKTIRAKANDGILRASVIGAGLLAPVLSMAQTTDPFDAAVASVTTKVTAYGGALVTFAAVSVAFFVAIKYVKKIPRAA